MSACHLPTPVMAAVSPRSLQCQATQLMVFINHSMGCVLAKLSQCHVELAWQVSLVTFLSVGTSPLLTDNL